MSCAICRTPTDPVKLTKSWCPDVIRGTVVDRVMWVCPACPLPGGPN
jgi:hypothetical protein